MGQWWAGPHFELDDLGVTILGPLNINLPSGSKDRLWDVSDLFVPRLCAVTWNTSPFTMSLAPFVGFFVDRQLNLTWGTGYNLKSNHSRTFN